MTNSEEGKLPFQDSNRSVDERVGDLLGRMTLEEKAGQMFQNITVFGPVDQGSEAFGLKPLKETIETKHMTFFNLNGNGTTGRQMAEWFNSAQKVAMSQRLPIPITLSSDPRHGFTDNPGTMMAAGPFSAWPESLGLAALRSKDRVRQFGDIVRQEYTAVGMHSALHPQADVMTEARWARCNGTFGEDADLVSDCTAAYIEGLQGKELGPHSVAAMVKHFPGGGPEKDGEDNHFEYGQDQVYPGDNMEYHLKPFKAAIAAGVTQVMPSYGKVVGTKYEEVGAAFNKGLLQDLLRDELRFGDGIICSDWGVISDATVAGQFMRARAWGMDGTTAEEKMLKALDAGVDQFGGEECTELLVSLVRSGKVPESRIDASVRKLLRSKFVLGLFDHPYVDSDEAGRVVGCKAFRDAGDQAQRDSLTLLRNVAGADGRPTLPLKAGVKAYVEGIDPAVAADYGTVVDSPEAADVAILRMKAPYEHRKGGFEQFMHAGSLDFTPEEIAHVREVGAAVPTVVDLYCDRPAIVAPLVDSCAALLVNYGASARNLLDVLFVRGGAAPKGRLPFDIPSSMQAVVGAKSDVPFDTKDPTFHFGDGLSY